MPTKPKKPTKDDDDKEEEGTKTTEHTETDYKGKPRQTTHGHPDGESHRHHDENRLGNEEVEKEKKDKHEASDATGKIRTKHDHEVKRHNDEDLLGKGAEVEKPELAGKKEDAGHKHPALNSASKHTERFNKAAKGYKPRPGLPELMEELLADNIDPTTVPELLMIDANKEDTHKEETHKEEPEHKHDPDDKTSSLTNRRALKKPDFYKIKEINEQFDVINLAILEAQENRRNGVLVLDERLQKAVEAACRDIVKSRLPELALGAVGVLCVLASVALCVVSHGGVLGIVAVPLILAKVGHAVTATKGAVKVIKQMREWYSDLGKEVRVEGQLEMLKWTQFGQKASEQDLEEYKIFKMGVGQRKTLLDRFKEAKDFGDNVKSILDNVVDII